jgi:nitroreductase
MDVREAIDRRRAFRSLKPTTVNDDLVSDLARCAGLAPSCFNNQPWRFVFVDDAEQIARMRDVLTEENAWAHRASMIVAVFSREEDDCVIHTRKYHQFDCGLASGFLILRAVELGLVAHPIAGFSPKKTRAVLGIPDEFEVITLIIIGAKDDELNPVLNDKQIAREKTRPSRLPLPEFAFRNSYPASSA